VCPGAGGFGFDRSWAMGSTLVVVAIGAKIYVAGVSDF
jgi:hypothetical protein